MDILEKIDNILDEKILLKKMRPSEKRRARLYRKKNRQKLKRWKKKYEKTHRSQIKRVKRTGRGVKGKKLGHFARRG